MAKAKNKFKKGDRVRVSTNDYAAYGVHQGTVVTVVSGRGGYYRVKEAVNVNISVQHLEIAKFSLQSLESDRAELESQLSLITEKLAYLQENNLEESLDEEFVAYNTLKLLDNQELTKLQKAQKLVALFKS